MRENLSARKFLRIRIMLYSFLIHLARIFIYSSNNTWKIGAIHMKRTCNFTQMFHHPTIDLKLPLRNGWKYSRGEEGVEEDVGMEVACACDIIQVSAITYDVNMNNRYFLEYHKTCLIHGVVWNSKLTIVLHSFLCYTGWSKTCAPLLGRRSGMT